MINNFYFGANVLAPKSGYRCQICSGLPPGCLQSYTNKGSLRMVLDQLTFSKKNSKAHVGECNHTKTISWTTFDLKMLVVMHVFVKVTFAPLLTFGNHHKIYNKYKLYLKTNKF